MNLMIKTGMKHKKDKKKKKRISGHKKKYLNLIKEFFDQQWEALRGIIKHFKIDSNLYFRKSLLDI
jgi:hypothetical protein